MFLLGILILVAYVATFLHYQAYAAIFDRSDWGFASRTSDQLITDLNTAKQMIPLGWVGISQRSIPAWTAMLIGTAVAFGLSYYFGRQVGVNRFSLHELYRNRLVRCYLGAARPARQRQPNPVTNFDAHDNLPIATLFPGAEAKQTDSQENLRAGPIHLINAALNLRVGEVLGNNEGETLALIDRKAESFTFSPLHCGSPYTGYRPTGTYSGGVDLGTAVAISGAAVSPNMGFHSSPSITALLTVFNVRLGAWLANPKRPTPKRDDAAKVKREEPGLLTLLYELLGLPDADRKYVYLSDGGHFENMGLYELLRRRCRFILAIDGGADSMFLQENIGNATRLAQIDFGARIEIDVSATRPDGNGFCKSHVAVGRIFYGHVLNTHLGDPNYNYDNDEGIIVYLKAGLTGDESADVLNYHATAPDFPNEPTLDQFYSESQFQSYRALGVHTAMNLFRGATVGGDAEPIKMMMAQTRVPGGRQDDPPAPTSLDRYSTMTIFKSLYDFWLARPLGFVGHYTALTDAWLDLYSKLRSEPKLAGFAKQLYGEGISGEESGTADADSLMAERLMLKEMLTVLEKAYFSLDFEHYWQHPTNHGLLNLFTRWVKVAGFKVHWNVLKLQFSPMFQQFIASLVENPEDA